MRILIGAVLAIGSCLASANTQAAPPTVTHFYPSGVQRGQTATITANGSFSRWPVKAWANRPGLKITAGKTKGKLQITADPKAHGVFLIRLYNAEGSSKLRPLVVDGVKEFTEKEPNGGLKKSQHVGSAGNVTGKLSKAGDVDAFSIDAKSGQTIVAALTANRLFGSPMDAVLQICDSRGFVLQQNDDSGGLDPLATYRVSKDGRYFVRVFAFPETPNSSIRYSGASTYVYRLTVTCGPYVDYVLPLASTGKAASVRLFGWNLGPQPRAVELPAGDSFAAAVTAGSGVRYLPRVDESLLVAAKDNSHKKVQNVSLPVTISGCIESPGDNDAFQFSAKKGQRIGLKVESRVLGFPLDALLQVRSTKDKLLQETDDASRKRDPQTVFKIPADGQYRVEVRDVNRAGGKRFAYRLSARVLTPGYQLSVASGHFVVKKGKSVEIPVTVNRAEGFSADVRLHVLDLPAGMSSKIVLSKGKKTAVAKIKITGTKLGGGPIRIRGEAKGNPDQIASIVVPKSQFKVQRLWITCVK